MQYIVIGVLVVLGALGTWLFRGNQSDTVQPTPSQPATNQDATSSTSQSAAYKDGTYAVVGNYRSPAGNESVKVSLTLANNKITAATFEGTATNPGSKYNQDKFKEGFKSVVIGKDIDSLNLQVVNGASLTTRGFMDAVAKVKVEAKS